MKKFLFDCGTRDPLASSGLLFLRVTTGLMMLVGHGVSKIQNFDKLSEVWTVPALWPLSYMSKPISLMATIGAEVGASAARRSVRRILPPNGGRCYRGIRRRRRRRGEEEEDERQQREGGARRGR